MLPRFHDRFSSAFVLFYALLFIFFNQQAYANHLSLPAYLNSIQEASLGFKGARYQSQASDLLKEQADLAYSYQLFANAEWGYDQTPPQSLDYTYNNMKVQTYSLGVSKNFDFGLQGKVTYAVEGVTYDGLIPEYIPGQPNITIFEGTPTLELTLPLWQNFSGSLTRLNYDSVLFQSQLQKEQAIGKVKGLLAQGEAAYWRLVAARALKTLQEATLKSAESILDYVTKKFHMHLGDKADVLQAQALVQSRKLDLTSSQQEIRSASRAFNALRLQAQEEVFETLADLPVESLNSVQFPTERPGDLADTKITAIQNQLADNSLAQQEETTKPTLEAFTTLGLIGVGTDLSSGISQSFQNSKESTYLGVRFLAPLDQTVLNHLRQGLELSKLSSQFNLQQQKWDQDVQWKDLIKKLKDAQESLEVAKNFQDIQKQKLYYERERMREGRTSTYQVLQFEQDYSTAQLLVVRSAALILSLKAQIQLFSQDVSL